MLPEQLRLTDGTIVRRCPTDKPLYCSRAGRFYSIHGMAITDEGCVMHEVQPSFSPVRRKRWRSSNGISGTQYPVMRHFDCKLAHRLMFATFADEPCPIFFDSKGNPYKGIVHHVIEKPYDIRMDNLMGWLTYKQHKIADKRRRALEAVLPDMYCVETAYLKTLQDPRKTDDIIFEMELNNLRAKYGKDNL